MKMPLHIFFLIALLNVRSPIVTAWDADGYEAIGMTSMSSLSQAALSKVKPFIGMGRWKDLTDLAEWTKTMNTVFPDLAPLYYQMQPRDNFRNSSEINLDISHCPNGLCLMNGIKYFYSKLFDLKSIPEITYFKGKKLTPMDSLIILTVLISDLHHPLSFGLVNDECGKKLQRTWHDGYNEKNTTLYDYWNSDIVQFIIKERPNYWNGGWTRTGNLGSMREAQEREKWRNANADKRLELVNQWALDSLRIAAAECYNVNSKQPELQLMDILVGFERLKEQMLLAGLRISLFLESVADFIEVQKYKGLPLIVRSDQVAATRYVPPGRIPSFIKNLSVLVVVLAIFGYATRYFS